MTHPDDSHKPLLVIVGETASGKSALALELAERFGGEIVCADSQTVYKGLDIGTAKPSIEEQARVPHYGLDLVTPDEQYNTARYKQYADHAIHAIHSRGRLPILVGGTGLYVDAVLYDYQFRSPADPKTRSVLENMSVEQLQEQIRERGIAMPTNSQNPRHLIRALETGGEASWAGALRANTLILGLAPDRDELRCRIARRVDVMFDQGLVAEATRASAMYGWDAPGLKAPAYKALRDYVLGDISHDEAKALFVKNDLYLAKRQRTWFRRNKSIHWMKTGEEYQKSVELITTLLNK